MKVFLEKDIEVCGEIGACRADLIGLPAFLKDEPNISCCFLAKWDQEIADLVLLGERSLNFSLARDTYPIQGLMAEQYVIDALGEWDKTLPFPWRQVDYVHRAKLAGFEIGLCQTAHVLLKTTYMPVSRLDWLQHRLLWAKRYASLPHLCRRILKL